MMEEADNVSLPHGRNTVTYKVSGSPLKKTGEPKAL